MLAYAFSNSLWKNLPETEEIEKKIFFRNLLVVTGFGLLYFTAQNWMQYTLLSEWKSKDLFLLILLSCFSFFGIFFYNKAINISLVSKTVIVSNASSIFGLIIAILFYQEELRWQAILAFILFSSAGIVSHKKEGYMFELSSKALLYSGLAAVVWGISFALFPYFAKKYGSVSLSVVIESSIMVLSFFIFLIKSRKHKKQKSIINHKALPYYVLLAICALIGMLGFTMAAEYLEVWLLSILGLLAPVLNIAVAKFYLKERLSKNVYMALVLLILGLIVLKT